MFYPPHLQQRYERENRLRDLFNQQSEDSTIPYRSPCRQSTIDKILADLHLCPDDQILDLGCGDGWLCRTLATLCPEGAIVGLDISDNIVRHAREQSVGLDNTLYSPGVAEEIPWAEEYFSRVVSVESAYYWSSPENALREIFRVMKPGGKITFLLSLHGTNTRASHLPEDLEALLQFKSAQEWVEIMKNSGFSQVESERLQPQNSTAVSISNNTTVSVSHPRPFGLQGLGVLTPLILSGIKPTSPLSNRVMQNSGSDPLPILN